MKYILVSGANKGIGRAVIEAVLRERPDCCALLGARDLAFGEAACDQLLARDPSWAERLRPVQLDVTSEASIASAQADLPALYGLVNNAGCALGTVGEVLDVNVNGMRRMCEAFAPGMEDGGRIVNVTSAAGPNFVARCDADRQAFFLDPNIGWDQLQQLMRSCEGLDPDDVEGAGMNGGSAYGLSKACANSYTLYLARRWPGLCVNACTPGFIETDLGTAFLGARTPQEAGMKSPAEGARVIMHLLFGEPEGSGQYFGSDSQRSPMDRYRAPGSPPYTGD